MDYIDFDLKILTPAFIAGADQKKVEIRTASIRGLVRWWWRALVGHEYGGDFAKLLNQEQRIFGGTRRDSARRSLVRFSIGQAKLNVVPYGGPMFRSGCSYEVKMRDRTQKVDVLQYLAYGPARILSKKEKTRDGRIALDPAFNERNGQARKGPVLIRPAFGTGTSFTLRLGWRAQELSIKDRLNLVKTVASWVTLGGLGSRSRKGWGALGGGVSGAATPDLQEEAEETFETQRSECLQDGKEVDPSRLPPFPQLSFRRIRIESTEQKWERALGSVGLLYRKIRKEGDPWVTGLAHKDSRRASSLIVSVHEDPSSGGLSGHLCLLPCKKSDQEQGSMARTFSVFESLA